MGLAHVDTYGDPEIIRRGDRDFIKPNRPDIEVADFPGMKRHLKRQNTHLLSTSITGATYQTFGGPTIVKSHRANEILWDTPLDGVMQFSVLSKRKLDYAKGYGSLEPTAAAAGSNLETAQRVSPDRLSEWFIGQTLQGEANDVGEADYYKFYAEPGDLVTIQVVSEILTRGKKYVDTKLDVYEPGVASFQPDPSDPSEVTEQKRQQYEAAHLIRTQVNTRYGLEQFGNQNESPHDRRAQVFQHDPTILNLKIQEKGWHYIRVMKESATGGGDEYELFVAYVVKDTPRRAEAELVDLPGDGHQTYVSNGAYSYSNDGYVKDAGFIPWYIESPYSGPHKLTFRHAFSGLNENNEPASGVEYDLFVSGATVAQPPVATTTIVFPHTGTWDGRNLTQVLDSEPDQTNVEPVTTTIDLVEGGRRVWLKLKPGSGNRVDIDYVDVDFVGLARPSLRNTSFTATQTHDPQTSSFAASQLSDAFSDPNPDAEPGIAIVGSNDALGLLQVLLNGQWVDLGPVSGSHALLVKADDETKFRIDPESGVAGNIEDALTVKAWDGSWGAAGTYVDTTDPNAQTAIGEETATVA